MLDNQRDCSFDQGRSSRRRSTPALPLGFVRFAAANWHRSDGVGDPAAAPNLADAFG
jgi:hypothetical protein